MSSKKQSAEEDYVFEFFDDDYAKDLDTVIPSIAEQYNDIDFQGEFNDEQLDIVNNINGPMLIDLKIKLVEVLSWV